MTYAIAVSDRTKELLACEPDSPNDQRVRAAADAHLGEGMRHGEPYAITNGLSLVGAQREDGEFEPTNWSEFQYAYASSDQQGWLADVDGRVYKAAIKGE